MSNRPRILIAEPDGFSQEALAILQDVAEVHLKAIPQAEINDALSLYDVLWIRLGLVVMKKDLPSQLTCRYLVTATTGTDHIDEEALRARGSSVLSLRGKVDFLRSITATAEHTLGLILALARKIPFAFDSVRAGVWNRDAFVGAQLAGKTAGIVGYGRLGEMVSGYLCAIGMNVLAYDVKELNEGLPVTMVKTLDELLGCADVVTVHVDLNDTTRGMFSADVFRRMKHGSLFINTSRGAVVDEVGLIDALQNGPLAGAALDTICGEPNIGPSSPLVAYSGKHSNLIITPHIGGAAHEARNKCEIFMAKRLCTEIVL